MKKKIVGILILMLMITSILPINTTVLAGDEENPEIVDETDDLFGTFIYYPKVFNFFKTLKIFDTENLDFIDIKSAWFYENPDKQEYLYSAIKIKNLEFINQRTIYAIHWVYNGKNYAVGVHVYSNGEIQSFFAGQTYWRWGPFYNATGTFDLNNDIVTFEISKNTIGNPKSGDKLTKTDAWTGLRFINELATIPLGGEVAKDWAGYGSDYTIKY